MGSEMEPMLVHLLVLLVSVDYLWERSQIAAFVGLGCAVDCFAKKAIVAPLHCDCSRSP